MSDRYSASVWTYGSRYITDLQARNIIEAIRFAKSLGLPLVGNLTIHWACTDVGDDADGKLFAKFRGGLNKWTRRRGFDLTAVWATFKLHASTGRGSKSFAFGLELTKRFSTETVKSVGEGLRHKHHEKTRSDAGSLKNLLKTLTKPGGSFCVRSSKPLVGCGQRLSESPAGTNILRWVNWRRHYPMARNEP